MADRNSPALDGTAPSGPRGSGERRWPVLAAMAAGGVLGALARHALLAASPQRPDSVDWTVVLVNMVGCALIGVLMEVLERRPGSHPLLRPFLGTGVLGGYTTFSASATDAAAALAAHRPEAALLALAANLAGALAAAGAASAATAAVLDRVAARREAT